MKTTIETTHRLTIKGQIFDLTPCELSELKDAVESALGSAHNERLEAIRRFVNGPSLSEIASVAVSATTEGRRDVTTDSSKQYVGSTPTAL